MKNELIISCVHNKVTRVSEYIVVSLTKGKKKVKFAHHYEPDKEVNVSVKLKRKHVKELIDRLDYVIDVEPNTFYERYKNDTSELEIKSTRCELGGIVSLSVVDYSKSQETIHIDRVDTINLIEYLKDLLPLMKS
ncbi:gp208 [Bacillus phage W.Ph.]|uniref:Gp208 n=1 Tax=Bacillus phage W.Ph. TaxID=764595 RepID=G9B1V9_9CAUD|nr:gp208 [Bacillus phage W.Ph.]ADH03354.1 gp208 [Bacillus phage W.Ph.]